MSYKACRAVVPRLREKADPIRSHAVAYSHTFPLSQRPLAPTIHHPNITFFL